ALGPDGEMARALAGRQIASFGNAENESYGIEYGYAYEESPVICAERGADIPNDPLRYTPTTFPGVRMPSVVLKGDTPIYDRLGLWFTLVCVGTPPSAALVEAAARRSVPLDVLRLDASWSIRTIRLLRPSQPCGRQLRPSGSKSKSSPPTQISLLTRTLPASHQSGSTHSWSVPARRLASVARSSLRSRFAIGCPRSIRSGCMPKPAG